MKVFTTAAVKEFRNYYEVIYLSSSLNNDFETNRKHIGLSSIAALEIRKAMSEDKIVRINSSYDNIDVQLHDLTFIDLDTSEEFTHRKILLRKVRQLVSHQQANVSGMMMFEYININNVLSDKGFFITDENKEEVYLEILEKGDEKLIEQLERYLNARDVISRSSFLEGQYTKFFADMEEADSMEKLNDLYETFISSYETYLF